MWWTLRKKSGGTVLMSGICEAVPRGHVLCNIVHPHPHHLAPLLPREKVTVKNKTSQIKALAQDRARLGGGYECVSVLGVFTHIVESIPPLDIM